MSPKPPHPNPTTSSMQPKSDNPINQPNSQTHPNTTNNTNNIKNDTDNDSSMVYARKRARKNKNPSKLGSKKRPRSLSNLIDHISVTPSQDYDEDEEEEEGDGDDDVVVVVVNDDDDENGGGDYTLERMSRGFENGTKSESSCCHQCKKSYKGRVVRCTMCKSNKFCIPCIRTRYPLLTEEEVALACPVCLNKCNCMTCLRLQSNSKGKIYDIRNQSSLLPILKGCIREQSTEKEQVTKIRDICSRLQNSVRKVTVDDATPENESTETPLPSQNRSSNQEGPTQTSEVGPTETNPNSIQNLFDLPMENWVRESIINGIKTIIDIISNYESTKSLLADQTRIFRSLTIINSIIDSACLRTTEISWLSTKVKDIIIAAETVSKIETLVDMKEIKALLSEQANYVSEISGLRVGLSEMTHLSLELKDEENELLEEEMRLRQRRESFLAKKKKVMVEMNEVRVSLDQKIKEKEKVDSRLDEVGIVKFGDVEKENGRLKSLVNEVISFSKFS